MSSAGTIRRDWRSPTVVAAAGTFVLRLFAGLPSLQAQANTGHAGAGVMCFFGKPA